MTAIEGKTFSKPADADHQLHDLLKHRWSPRAFAPRAVPREQLLSLFEAARWSPSANNSQPWAFVAATQDDPEGFEKVAGLLNERNQVWARSAPVLVVTLAKRDFDATRPNLWGSYDLGQAVAHLSIQAQALGLIVHQMAGFDRVKAPEILGIPEGWDAFTLFAVGYQDEPETLPQDLRDREKAVRVRKPLTDFVFEKAWGQPLA